MVLCGTWSETSVAQSQLTQFWQIPRHRTLSYSLWTPFFVTIPPLAVEPGSTPRPIVQKKTWRDSLPIDMLLSAVSVLVVAQSSSEIPEWLLNNPVYQWQSMQNEHHMFLEEGLDWEFPRCVGLSETTLRNVTATVFIFWGHFKDHEYHLSLLIGQWTLSKELLHLLCRRDNCMHFLKWWDV